MKIGVFDSGMGGLSVAQAIEKALPEHTAVFRNDAEHVPYGTRPVAEIKAFVEPILQVLVEEECQVIVIACNTVSTTLINELRERFTVPLIAVEPMVKPAAKLTKSGVIAVCATPRTLSSDRYNWLKDTYATGIKVLEPDCSDWSRLIEDNEIDEQKITHSLQDVLAAGADVIVLGCTHYHWIEEDIVRIAAGRAEVLHPEKPVIAQLRRVIARLA